MIRDDFLMDWIYSSQIRPNLSKFDYRVTGIAYVTVPADPHARVLGVICEPGFLLQGVEPNCSIGSNHSLDSLYTSYGVLNGMSEEQLLLNSRGSRSTVPVTRVMKTKFIQGVEIINVCEVIKAIYGDGYWTMPHKDRPSYNDRCKAVAKWAAENGADIYAEDHRDYSETRAAFRAWKSGFRRVVVEDLSLSTKKLWIGGNPTRRRVHHEDEDLQHLCLLRRNPRQNR